MRYSELGLTRIVDKDTFIWNDKKISYIKYLPVEAKYDIVMITLQKAFENGIYNPIKLDMFFHLNLIYMYTDLEFTDEERENEDKLYDEMRSTGFIDEFLKVINADEYAEMQEDIENIAKLHMDYLSSAGSVIRTFIEDLPAHAEAAQSIVDNFDKEKFQNVIDFAQAANGKRPIS